MTTATLTKESSLPNHPKANGMALIAALTFNVGAGSIMGTQGVMMPHLREHLGVSIEMVPLGMLAIVVSSGVFAPKIGSMVVRHTLRSLLAAASIMLGTGWFLISITASFALYLSVCALLFGPALSIMCAVFSPTLVTRWFRQNRGLAIGLVHLPITVAIMPVATEWLIQQIGLQSTGMVLAAIPILTTLPASFLVQDWPPDQHDSVANAASAAVDHGPSLTIRQMLAQSRFWTLTCAVAVPNASSLLLAQHLVSMAGTWNIDPLPAAGLASIMATAGMFGTVALGFIVDRIGGARTLALMAAADLALWLLLLTQPTYPVLAVIIASIGLVSAGSVPAISKAYADTFGLLSFSTAIGLMTPLMIPLSAVGLVGPGLALRFEGSYSSVILAMVGAFFLSAALAISATKPLQRVSTTPAVSN